MRLVYITATPLMNGAPRLNRGTRGVHYSIAASRTSCAGQFLSRGFMVLLRKVFHKATT
jgi:hypothetical protein